MPTRTGFQDAGISLRNLLDNLDEAGVAPQRVAIELSHVWANIEDKSRAVRNLLTGLKADHPITAHGGDSLFHLAHEPPLRQVANNGECEDELAAADESKSEECCTAHDFRVVQITAHKTRQVNPTARERRQAMDLRRLEGTYR